MRGKVKDVLFGIVIMVVITILEFVITIPFGHPGELSQESYAQFINRELLWTALPAALVTFLFTWLLKAKRKSEAFQKSIIWTIIMFVNYFLIGIGNNNLTAIFGTFGIYTLLVGVFAGPVVYAKLKHLE